MGLDSTLLPELACPFTFDLVSHSFPRESNLDLAHPFPSLWLITVSTLPLPCHSSCPIPSSPLWPPHHLPLKHSDILPALIRYSGKSVTLGFGTTRFKCSVQPWKPNGWWLIPISQTYPYQVVVVQVMWNSPPCHSGILSTPSCQSCPIPYYPQL